MVACQEASRIPTDYVDSSRAWQNRVTTFIAEGKCTEAVAVLESAEADHGVVAWYELRSVTEGLCWKKYHRSDQKARALAIVEKGIRMFPSASILLADKAALLDEFGEHSNAEPLYRAARLLALKNLKANPESRSDRFVLRRVEKHLSMPEARAPSSNAVVPEADSDLVFTQPTWQLKASALLSGDDCIPALRYLNDNRHSDDPMWFELYSQADFRCWKEGFGEQYRNHGIVILDQGLKRLPSSSRLLMSKGDRAELLGDHAAAAKFYEQARGMAERNLAQHGRQEDKDVLDQLNTMHK
jgi:tetratricopeptide (TPR) repeat protein